MFKIILIFGLAVFLLFSILFVIRYWMLKSRVMKKIALLNVDEVQEWSDEFLQSKRMMTDDLADTVVKQIMATSESEKVNHLFQLITKNKYKLPDDVPIELRNYFTDTAKLPDWADKDMINLGQQVYIRHGIWISLLLSYKSLPECYSCAKGAQVLHMTARLNERHGSKDTFSRRIAETAQFVLFCMEPGGLDEDGRGIEAAQKLRLIHAVIRYYIHKNNWDTETYDKPINQEDMAGTLMSFSSLIFEGLSVLGIELEDFEKEAYMHCWRVIGYLIGLDDDLIPKNSGDAVKLGNRILKHQMANSPQGSELMKSLLYYQNDLGNKTTELKNIATFRYMMGHDLSDVLDIPQANQTDIDKVGKKFRRITKIMEWLDHSLIFAMLIQWVSRLGINMVIKKMTKADIINFYLPKSLTLDWNFTRKK